MNPPSTNHTVTALFNAVPAEGKVGCVALSNADPTSPIGTVQTQDIEGPTGASYVLSTSITSTYAYSMLVDVFGGSDPAGGATQAAGQTSRWERLITNSCAGSSTKPLTTPGDTTDGWTINNSQVTRLQHAVAEIKIAQ